MLLTWSKLVDELWDLDIASKGDWQRLAIADIKGIAVWFSVQLFKEPHWVGATFGCSVFP